MHLDELAAFCRAERARLKLSRQVVCERAGVSMPTVFKLENGQGSPSLAVVDAVLGVYGFRMEPMRERTGG